MSSHPFDVLTLDNGAKLVFTPCPGTKEQNLADSIATLKQAGTDMLLTLMFDDEMETNNASALPTVCEHQQTNWTQLPIQDDAAPDALFEKQWLNHKQQILNTIKQQGTIAVHCKGGSGRTGLVIAIILLAYGYSADNIIEQVQKVRPKALTNPVQLNYFNSYL